MSATLPRIMGLLCSLALLSGAVAFAENGPSTSAPTAKDASSKQPPARVGPRKPREIAVTVLDRKKRPLAGVKVGVNRGLTVGRPGEVLDQKLTDRNGKAVLRVAPEVPLQYVFAVKKGAGFDYFVYSAPHRPLANSYLLPFDDNRPITFVLGGVHRMRLHLVDERHRPLAGVGVSVGFVQRPNKGDGVANLQIDEFRLITDREGIAEFDAIPVESSPALWFHSTTLGYFFLAHPGFNRNEPTTDFEVVAEQQPVLRVEVTLPDGRPAIGAQIEFVSRPIGDRVDARGNRRTGGGTIGTNHLYSGGVAPLFAFSEDAYCLVRATSGHLASPAKRLVVRPPAPLLPVHLVLQPGIRVHGSVTVGKDGHAAANEHVTLLLLDDQYSKLSEDEQPPGIPNASIDMPYYARTDAEGRFEFFVAPGHYILGIGTIYFSDILKAKDTKTLFVAGASEFQLPEKSEVEVNLHEDWYWTPQMAQPKRRN
jgi:hypothetical protein